tara:strand:- start:219 stop:1871 length:1653 start_codon:yes stop_codon:yes gene_type:complete
MGILKTSEKNYYRGYGTEGVEVFGDYQFTSLETIINQFQIAYVGEGKIIPKLKRSDIAFHAMRALQEFSFDTFKSIKSYQIDLPPSLVMPLPHDYVNYTKLSWVDTSGIKHLIYPTSKTNNPFQIRQNDSGEYSFPSGEDLLVNGDFSLTEDAFKRRLHNTWNVEAPKEDLFLDADVVAGTKILGIHNTGPVVDTDNGLVKFYFSLRHGGGVGTYAFGVVHTIWQEVDVSDKSYVTLSADGVADTVAWTQKNSNGAQIGSLPTSVDQVGVLRVGLRKSPPDENYWNNLNNIAPGFEVHTSNNLYMSADDFLKSTEDTRYLEWRGPSSAGSTSSTKELINIDVSKTDKAYIVVTSYVEHSLDSGTGLNQNTKVQNSIDNITLKSSQRTVDLTTPVGNETESSTWNSYTSITPNENKNDDYEDDVYWPYDGRRYGLDPQHAQVNGSFFIDPRLGRIHFSSNISGKTVILDYISDSLGTDDEMKVHKFAEEAMYKCMAYSVLSTSSLPMHQQLVPRFKKEKYAETRKAKLRLSNIKLEELTQILRGRSKQIKH